MSYIQECQLCHLALSSRNMLSMYCTVCTVMGEYVNFSFEQNLYGECLYCIVFLFTGMIQIHWKLLKVLQDNPGKKKMFHTRVTRSLTWCTVFICTVVPPITAHDWSLPLITIFQDWIKPLGKSSWSFDKERLEECPTFQCYLSVNQGKSISYKADVVVTVLVELVKDHSAHCPIGLWYNT